MLELAGNAAKDNKKTRIMPRHLLLATRNDEELSKLLDGITIAHSGVLPNIHSVLFSKKANMLTNEGTNPSLSSSSPRAAPIAPDPEPPGPPRCSN
uniref:Histone H2A n=1 Tax=Aegilops tauschii subsp. strangulata TaxID=200361 RepID=A0A453GXS8_AEGTS